MNLDFLSINDQQLTTLNTLYDFLIQSQFKCVRSKTKDIIYTFTKASHKKNIIKLTQDKQGNIHLWIRFSSSNNYSSYFNQMLIKTLEEDDYKYVGCYEYCHECDIKKGYTVITPKETYFRCHKELIHIGRIDEVPLLEAIDLIYQQDLYETQSYEENKK
ncbi:MAG: hypothetical protein HGB31_09280 [Erysipelotrichaceae bacterium]|nr:hypothetical protein [Erysipelotrichaceae bacterium]